ELIRRAFGRSVDVAISAAQDLAKPRHDRRVRVSQDLRSFVERYGAAHPGEVVRIGQPVSLEFDIQAVILELERRRRFPILLFESVQGSDIAVIANVMASRRGYAFAFGTDLGAMPMEYARRLKQYLKPVVLDDPPFGHTTLIGDQVDLGRLPIPTFFP